MSRVTLPLIVLLCVPLGCVRRTVTVNTDPQGATVILNDQQIGTSPVSIDFTWYGDYDVQLQLEGYETLRTNHRLHAPWYQIPPFDFVAEALMPFEIHDQQVMNFTLEPAKPVDRNELIESARDLRERALFESEAGAPATRPAETQPQ